MRCQYRNKQTVYYATVSSKTELTDSYGNRTGQFRITYSEPAEILANVGWQTGLVIGEQFGINTNPTMQLVYEDPELPIEADSILWIGITPDEDGEDGAIKHNFVVSGSPQRSINGFLCPIMEVMVS